MPASLRVPVVVAKPGRIDDIELLRAFAVLLVVLEHAHGNLIAWPIPAFDLFNRYFNGGVGVDLFFAISGFVIARDLFPRLSAASDWRAFLRLSTAFWVRRAWRILPSAWLWLTLILLAALSFNQSGAFRSPDAAIAGTIAAVLQFYNLHFASCFMQFDCGANFVYWSLSLEEQFYLILPFLLFCFRRGLAPLLLLLIAMQVLTERSLTMLMFRTDALLLGVLLAIAGTRGRVCEPHWLAALGHARGVMTIGLIGLLAAAATDDWALAAHRHGVVALGATLLVWLASFDRRYLMPPSPIKRLLVWLGSRSYAIYLIHVPVFYAIRELAYRAGLTVQGDATPPLLFVGAATALILLLADLNFRWVETPGRRKGMAIAASIAGETPHPVRAL